MPKVAMCPSCKRPLISTFIFSGAEFFCRECKGTFGWLEPRPADETPELLAIIESDREWFVPLARKCMAVGMKRSDCEQCSTGDDYSHRDHATETELNESKQAYAEILAQVELPEESK